MVNNKSLLRYVRRRLQEDVVREEAAQGRPHSCSTCNRTANTSCRDVAWRHTKVNHITIMNIVAVDSAVIGQDGGAEDHALLVDFITPNEVDV
jgi:hypothetical protein